MALKQLVAAGLGAFSVIGTAQAQSTACEKSIAPQHAAPSVAPGFRVEVVANELRDPRSILFDQQGGLLVVEQGRGVSRLSLKGDGACVRVEGQVQSVVQDEAVSFATLGYGDQLRVDSQYQLNHGIALSQQRLRLGLRCFPRQDYIWL
jgi:glucose/arabinose dehydrogenase